MNRKKYDAVATIGEYTTKTGEKKKRYTTIGSVFEDNAGRLSLKLDCVPVGPEWSGWVSFYEPTSAQNKTNEPEHRKRSQAPVSAPLREDDEEIPF
jgi:hypothetical protein